eukprot:106517_1
MSLLIYILLIHSIQLATSTTLNCNEKNSFRIVQFTDTHFGESHIGNYMTTSLMNNILDKEQPDLVVLTGDIISGYTWTGNKGWFENLWSKVVQPMIQRNIPWIFTPGNHDAEGEWNRSQIFNHEINKYSHLGSLTQIGYIDNKTQQNIYFVDIHNDKTSVARIWMIDSGMNDCNNDYDYFGCIQQSQMEWYLKQTHNIPGIIYMHIPSIKLMTYYNKKRYPTIGKWTGNNINCFDETHLNNKEFVDYLFENDDIMAMFHGHEHIHDSLILYENDLLIGFGRKSGEGWMIGVDIDFVVISGVRVFEFKCDNVQQWNTWIRDKYMNVIDRISYDEMKKKKNELEKKYNDDNVVCDVDDEQCNKEIKCLSGRYWESWKPSVEKKFKHWMSPYYINIIDICCRYKIVRFINDYVWDLGMTVHEASKI